MSVLEAVVLGIVQGLTEFLPISSTAHLRIVPAFLGWQDPGAAFTAVTQIGTLLAVLVYFRKEISRYSRAFLQSCLHRAPYESPDSRMAWWILLGTIPISVFGLLLKSWIETSFRSLEVIACSLIILGVLLAVAERFSLFNRRAESMRFLETQFIGFAQAFALVPGASRSGVTITAGLFLHLTREEAASFSFLLSIPAVALSGVYQLYKLRNVLAGEFGFTLAIATFVSAVVGFLSIAFLLRYLRRHNMFVFILYRIVLGSFLLLAVYLNILSP